MSRRELVCGWDSQALPWLSISEKRWAGTCCSSLTTSFVSCRLVRRYPPSWAACHLLWAISPHWPRRWDSCKSGLPRPNRVLSPLCRPSTCPLMTLPIRPQLPLSPTWTLRRCSVGPYQSRESTRPWIRWIPPAGYWNGPRSVTSTMTRLHRSRRFCSGIRTCRTSSPFWVWMSSLTRTRSLSRERGRYPASCPSEARRIRYHLNGMHTRPESDTSGYLDPGGRRLSGTVNISGAKNSALKLMAATLLADGESTLHRVPDIQDVRTMWDVLEHPVSYTHLRAHETKANLVCRLLLEKK